jgi:ABC-type amino acid transport substrate-binding protein
MKNAIMGAEKGSAGESTISANQLGKEYVSFPSQLDAFNQLKAGTVDVIVIDSVMANYYISLDK